MKRVVSILLFLILLAGCAHALTEQDKKDFDAQADEARFPAKRILPPSAKSRTPLRAGQWATVETLFKDGKGAVKSMNLATYKVIRVQGDTVTFEIEITSAGSPKPSTVAYVVNHLPSASNQLGMSKSDFDHFVDRMEIKRIVTPNGDATPTKLYSKNLLLSRYRAGNVKNEPCKTDILQSTRCLGYDFVAEELGHTVKGHVDAHASVPIVGFVRQDSEQYTSQVLAFGMSGAVSKLIH
jgi:hypothetical protein